MTAIKLEVDELLACRICLATDLKLFGIVESKLVDAFADILGTPVSSGDGLPDRVCGSCRTALRRSAELRARARAAVDVLRRLLLQQHYITTDTIRAIDRTSLRLDDKTNIRADYPTDTEYPETDFQDSVSDHDDKSDVDLVDTNIVETTDVVDNGRSVEDVKLVETGVMVENSRNDVKKEKRKRIKNERKKVIKVKAKPEVEWVVKKKPVRKKTGFKRYFMCDEDYIKFEEKYNIQVIRLSEEEQAAEMEARRRAASYRGALVRCERCCKGFLSAFTYENHLKVHDPAVSGPNECRWCGCRFKWPNNLRTHLIETHQLKYVCKQCQRVVKGRHEALLHAEYHAGKTWQCGHCARTFKKKSTFYTHVRMNHATSEPTSSTCELCGESFKGPPGLKLHQIKKCNKNRKAQETAAPTIVARKGFICEVCGKNCTSLSILAVHLRAHTGDRPHACPGCPLRFAKKDNMEKHHRVVHLGQRPQVACGVCGKLLAHAASLKLHVNTVHLKLPAPPRAPRPPRTRRKHNTC
ncbi:zinc finger protein 568-like [Cydia pomonella]|uniref:zinc finger protein 568-like n=1 Tax=Cydia pomonella TaxID=82600 RepID=UPI002ADE637A|nr:zinc finger protein 568-like [Cydia pomonella]